MLDGDLQLDWVPARPLGTSSAGHDGDFNELFYEDTLENQVWHFDFLYKVNRGKRFIIIIKEDLYSEYLFFSPLYPVTWLVFYE